MKLGRLALVVVILGVCGFGGGAGWGAGGPDTLPRGAETGGAGVNPGKDLTPEMAIDEPTLAKATQRGEAMVKGARWEVPAPMDIERHWAMFDAGSSLVCSYRYPLEETYVPGNAAVVVDKATGKALWPQTTGITVMAVAAGEKGGEMAVFRWTGAMEGERLGRAPRFSMEMVNVADLAMRWAVPVALYSDSALIAGKQVFIGASAPGVNVVNYARPGGGLRMPVTQTSVALELRAYDRETGKAQWRYALPAGTLTARPEAYVRGVLYVVAKVGPPDPNPPFSRQATVLIGLDAVEGKQLFVARSVGKQPGARGGLLEQSLSSPAVTDDVVVAFCESGELVGFDGKTGQEAWRESISLSQVLGKVTLGRLSFLDNEGPVVAGDKILVRAGGTTNPPSTEEGDTSPYNRMAGLAAFDVKTHNQVWFFRPPEDTAEYRSGNGVRKRARQLRLLGVQVEKDQIVALATGSRTEVVGVNLKSGKLEWVVPVIEVTPLGPEESMKPLVSNGVMYMVKGGMLMAVPLEGK